MNPETCLLVHGAQISQNGVITGEQKAEDKILKSGTMRNEQRLSQRLEAAALQESGLLTHFYRSGDDRMKCTLK